MITPCYRCGCTQSESPQKLSFAERFAPRGQRCSSREKTGITRNQKLSATQVIACSARRPASFVMYLPQSSLLETLKIHLFKTAPVPVRFPLSMKCPRTHASSSTATPVGVLSYARVNHISNCWREFSSEFKGIFSTRGPESFACVAFRMPSMQQECRAGQRCSSDPLIPHDAVITDTTVIPSRHEPPPVIQRDIH